MLSSKQDDLNIISSNNMFIQLTWTSTNTSSNLIQSYSQHKLIHHISSVSLDRHILKITFLNKDMFYTDLYGTFRDKCVTDSISKY